MRKCRYLLVLYTFNRSTHWSISINRTHDQSVASPEQSCEEPWNTTREDFRRVADEEQAAKLWSTTDTSQKFDNVKSPPSTKISNQSLLRRLIDVKEPKKKSQQEEEEDGVEGKNILELSALHCIFVDDGDVHCNDDELGCCLRRSVPASGGKGEGKS